MQGVSMFDMMVVCNQLLAFSSSTISYFYQSSKRKVPTSTRNKKEASSSNLELCGRGNSGTLLVVHWGDAQRSY